jgi:hypothetical protein
LPKAPKHLLGTVMSNTRTCPRRISDTRSGVEPPVTQLNPPPHWMRKAPLSQLTLAPVEPNPCVLLSKVNAGRRRDTSSRRRLSM